MAEIDLFAVQPYVTAQTYVSEEAFRHAMSHLATECRLRRRKDADGNEVPALAVFPENIATFLALTPLGRLRAALPSADLAAALALLVRRASLGRSAPWLS